MSTVTFEQIEEAIDDLKLQAIKDPLVDLTKCRDIVDGPGTLVTMVAVCLLRIHEQFNTNMGTNGVSYSFIAADQDGNEMSHSRLIQDLYNAIVVSGNTELALSVTRLLFLQKPVLAAEVFSNVASLYASTVHGSTIPVSGGV